jgi:MrcB-like, N-terminal domain
MELRQLWDEVLPRPAEIGPASLEATEPYFHKLNQVESASEGTKGSIQSLLEEFLSKSDGIRKSTPYGKHPLLWPLVGRLKAGICAFPAMESRPQIRLGWSLGAGNWANIPWISLLDERETTSTERGVYIVYLKQRAAVAPEVRKSSSMADHLLSTAWQSTNGLMPEGDTICRSSPDDE